MTNRIFVAILAATLAVTSVAPASALDRREKRNLAIVGGALLFMGAILANKKPSHSTVTRHSSPTFNDRVYHAPATRKVVPTACLRNNASSHGPRQYFSGYCLQQNMRHAGSLPGSCRTQVWTSHGSRLAYSAYCLRQHGWVFG